MKKILIAASIICMITSDLFSQSEQLIINPDLKDHQGHLTFENPKGSVKVTGYDGDVIVVTGTLRFGDPGKIRGKDETGLKKIDQNMLDLSAAVNGTTVDLQCKTSGKTVDFDIKIPRNYSLKLKTLDNGTVEVVNINGEIEVENTDGDISLMNISGSAVLSSVYGKISASFREVTPNSPMMFTSFEGDISITLPQSVNAKMKMKSEKGEIFSDFEMKSDKREPVINKVDSTKIYSLEDWVVRNINSGGPEYVIKTYDGNIILRKK